MSSASEGLAKKRKIQQASKNAIQETSVCPTLLLRTGTRVLLVRRGVTRILSAVRKLCFRMLIRHGRLRLILWLRYVVRTIQEECHNLFESFFSNVHSSVNALARFGPIDFSGVNVPGLSRGPISEFNL